MPEASRKLLVLDLDETLVFASAAPLERPPDFRVGPYHVYKRPFLDRFLAEVSARFAVAVWTSGSADYAQALVPLLLPAGGLEFVWARDRCTMVFDAERRTSHLAKNLHKLRRRGYRLEEIIVVDDSPEKHARAYGNLVRVQPYGGATEDDELVLLLEYLEQLRQVPNVRAIEKRGWRARVRRPEGSSP